MLQRIVAPTIAESDALQHVLDQRFGQHSVIELNVSELLHATSSTDPFDLVLGDRTFRMILTPHDVRTPGYRSEGVVDDGPCRTYAGRIEDDDGSDVRMLILPGFVQGSIVTTTDVWFIDPLSEHVPGSSPTQSVLFRATDGLGGTLTDVHCGVEESLLDAAADEVARGQSSSETTQRQQYTLLLATDADYQMFQKYGTNTNLFIQGIVNRVSGLFETAFDLRVMVVYQRVLTSNLHYTSTNPAILLNQFQTHWEENKKGIPRSVAHLFTNRNLDGNVLGLAYLGTVCNHPTSAYGLSSYAAGLNDLGNQSLLAHELCHNLGLGHVTTSCSEPRHRDRNIMCADFGVKQEFTAGQVTGLRSHVDSHSGCLHRGFFSGPFSPARRVDDDAYTHRTPALARLNDTSVVFWQAHHSSRAIYFASSTDGRTWTPNDVIDDDWGQYKTSNYPTAAVLGSTIHLAWHAYDGGYHIWYASSTTGKKNSWTSAVRIVKDDAASIAPTLAGFRSKVYLFYPQNKDGRRIRFSSSTDGTTWSASADLGTDATFSTSSQIAAIGFKVGGVDVLLVAWRGADGCIYGSTSQDGTNWSERKVIAGEEAAGAPAAALESDKVVVAWGHWTGKIRFTTSVNGTEWTSAQPVSSEHHGAKDAPALLSAGVRPMMLAWPRATDDDRINLSEAVF